MHKAREAYSYSITEHQHDFVCGIQNIININVVNLDDAVNNAKLHPDKTQTHPHKAKHTKPKISEIKTRLISKNFC